MIFNSLIRNSGLKDFEAEYILTALLKKPRHRLYLEKKPIAESLVKRFYNLVAKRKQGVPIQYLTKTAYFLDLELYVDSRVFIPRPETEELVEETKKLLPVYRPPLTANEKWFYDIGTGSGCIAIALARIFPEAKVIATDISKDSLKVARLNILRYKLQNRVSLVLTSDITKLRPGCDLLISNPPYIRTEELPFLNKEVRDFEPRISLDGGKDGLKVILEIISKGKRLLKPGGLLALEISPELKGRLQKLEPSIFFKKDSSGRIRFAFLKKNE